MTCYRPLTGWRSAQVNPSGKRSMVFNPNKAEQPDDPQAVQCGQCIGCRLKHSREWAIRCMHEATLHKDNIFLTLTFSDEELNKRPNPGTVDVRDLQKFFYRLRTNIRRDPDQGSQKLRYFACGEYGEKTGRPHYHALIFGWKPPDARIWKKARSGNPLYNSEFIEKAWPYGYAPFGDITFDSASYTARYCLKKITGQDSREHYTWVDGKTSEIRDRQAEFAVMSRRPGIAKDWLDKHGTDIYRDDYVIVKNKKLPLPKYYNAQLEKSDPEWYAEIRDARQERALKEQPHIDEHRRVAMHLAHYKRQEALHREIEEPNPNDALTFHPLRQQSQDVPKAVLHAQRRYSYKGN